MTTFAINHMTVAKLSYADLLDLAAGLGCVGVEVRNDLPQPLFDGMAPEAAGDAGLNTDNSRIGWNEQFLTFNPPESRSFKNGPVKAPVKWAFYRRRK